MWIHAENLTASSQLARTRRERTLPLCVRPCDEKNSNTQQLYLTTVTVFSKSVSRHRLPRRNYQLARPIQGAGKYSGLRQHLLLDPSHCLFHSVAQTDGRFPVKIHLNERVIAVTAV